MYISMFFKKLERVEKYVCLFVHRSIGEYVYRLSIYVSLKKKLTRVDVR